MSRGKRYRYDEYEFEEERPIKKKKKKKKKHIFLKIFVALLMIIAVLAGAAVGFTYSMLDQINYDNRVDKNTIEVNEGVETPKGIMNILLFGVDSRDQGNSYDASLSDVIMVVSINHDTKKVKIASIYRDTYLERTDTKKFDKITHSFMKGPQNSINTINKNLDLDIKDYVAINFNVVVDVVDAVEGVTVTVTDQEASLMRNYIEEINNSTGHKSKKLTKGGTYTLDGVQATAYARIRQTAGGDWKRTERQREVLNLVFEKAKKMNIVEIKKIADKVLKQVSTNVSSTDIISLAAVASSYEIEETEGWPFEVADYQPAEVWYGVPRNLEKQVKQLHQFLFNKEDYQVSNTVKTISDKMIRQTGIK